LNYKKQIDDMDEEMNLEIRELQDSDDLEKLTDLIHSAYARHAGDPSRIIRVLLCPWLWSSELVRAPIALKDLEIPRKINRRIR
jgi:hypothetical protein